MRGHWSELSYMATYGLLFQRHITIEIQLNLLMYSIEQISHRI
jgi:hypothetical protein